MDNIFILAAMGISCLLAFIGIFCLVRKFRPKKVRNQEKRILVESDNFYTFEKPNLMSYA